MKKKLMGFFVTSLLSIQGCGSADQLNNDQHLLNAIQNESTLNAELEAGKKCVEDLSFFERIYWNGFVSAWEDKVEDNFDFIAEADKLEARRYEEVLRYQIGCNFAKGNIEEEQIHAWAEQIKARESQPKLILPEIKIIYGIVKKLIQF